MAWAHLSTELLRESPALIPALIESLPLLFFLYRCLILNIFFLFSSLRLLFGAIVPDRAIMMLGHLLLTRVIIVVIIVYILVVIGVLLVDRLRFFSDIIVLVYDCILVCIGSHRMVLVELILLLDEEIMCRCWNLTWYQRV